MTESYRFRELYSLLPGDVILTWDHGLISKGIAWFERKDVPKQCPPYSHAEIVIEGRTMDGVSPIVLSAEPRGLLLREATRHAKKQNHIHIFRYQHITDLQRQAIGRLAQTMASKDAGYDWLSLLHFAARSIGITIHGNQERHFCSEATVQLLRSAGIRIREGETPAEITPRELGWSLLQANDWPLIIDLV